MKYRYLASYICKGTDERGNPLEDLDVWLDINWRKWKKLNRKGINVKRELYSKPVWKTITKIEIGTAKNPQSEE